MNEQIELLRFLITSCEREALNKLNTLLSDLNLTAKQAEVLLLIDKYGSMSVKKLGQLIICERRSPSRLVQTMITKKMLVKVPHAEDKRVSQLSLSPKGRKLIPKVKKASGKFNDTISQYINTKQLPDLIKMLSGYISGTESAAKLNFRFHDVYKKI